MLFSLPVFMYHSISRSRSRLCVSPELFEEHCRTLAEHGWRGIPLAEAEHYFLRSKSLPQKSCLFTFDDGYLDNYVYAEPILRKYGHYGVIFPVANMLAEHGFLRPTMETLDRPEKKQRLCARLDKRPSTKRSGQKVSNIAFCSWAEIRHMHENGNMQAAAHSMRHDRVVKALDYTELYTPTMRRDGFFSVPPYTPPFGFPVFDLGHYLGDRAYAISPEVFTLVEKLVPQEKNEAATFLASSANVQKIRAAVASLPCLGLRESEEQYRQRINREFAECRAVFKEKLDAVPVSFCWPWGHGNAVARQEARKHGFTVFFTTKGGPNLPGLSFHVHRSAIRKDSGAEVLHIAEQQNNPLFASRKMAANGLALLIKTWTKWRK